MNLARSTKGTALERLPQLKAQGGTSKKKKIPQTDFCNSKAKSQGTLTRITALSFPGFRVVDSTCDVDALTLCASGLGFRVCKVQGLQSRGTTCAFEVSSLAWW